MNPRFGLEAATLQKISDVLAKHPQVERAVLYGSRAKGNYKNGSDIDLTLIGGDDLTLDVLYRILDELEDSTLPYTFDLSIFRQIGDPDVVDHIRRVGVVLYERKPVTTQP